MSAFDGSGRPPLDWRRLLPMGLAIGLGPAIGRDVAAALHDPLGSWPARLAGYATAAVAAIAVYGVTWLVFHRRGSRPDAEPVDAADGGGTQVS